MASTLAPGLRDLAITVAALRWCLPALKQSGLSIAVWRRAAGIVFLHGRLHFHYPDGTRAANNAGGPSCLIAYGEYDCSRLQSARLPGSFLPITPRVLIDFNHGSGFQYSAG